MVVSAAERLQKVLSQLGLGSRREAEAWIRAGRITVNGKAAALGMRVGADDQLKLDGRAIRRQVTRDVPVFICHRSPGEPLLPARTAARSAEAGTGAAPGASIAERFRALGAALAPLLLYGYFLLRSGYIAAEWVAQAAGKPAKFVVPDVG